MTFEPGDLIGGRYELGRQLGAGGMARVYLGHDRLLDRQVAVKFVSALDASSLQRFLDEARAVARVQHPNVVTLHRVGQLESRPYLITEYVRGQSLEQLARPLPWPRVLPLAIDLARGLGAAHRQGVLHRDVKPGNALVTEQGELKLVDFGQAETREV